jgi:hypothetical protein
MTTSTFEKRMALFTRIGQLVFVLVLASQTIACDGGREGDRCVAALSHNDCNDGFTCTTIIDNASGATCGESYCCPTTGTSSSPYCNASLIGPAPDGAPGVCPIPATAAPSNAGGDTGTEAGPEETGPEETGAGDGGPGDATILDAASEG